MSWLLWTVLQWTFGYICVLELWFSQGMCPVVGCWVTWEFYSWFFKKSPYCSPLWLCNLPPYQLCKRISSFPNPHQHLLFVGFLMVAILNGLRWYLSVALICISLRMSTVELFFMCLLTTCISSLEKHLFRSSACFLIGLFPFLILSCTNCFYILEINCLLVASLAIIFSHSEGYLFVLLLVSYTVQKALRLFRSHLFIWFLYSLFYKFGQNFLFYCKFLINILFSLKKKKS